MIAPLKIIDQAGCLTYLEVIVKIMPRRSNKPDSSLSVLLDLDGTNIGAGTRHWVKIRAWEIEPDEARPHGIR